jgi:hypothetical protein
VISSFLSTHRKIEKGTYLFEDEYEYRDAEYEYEKKHEQCGAPKSPQVLF